MWHVAPHLWCRRLAFQCTVYRVPTNLLIVYIYVLSTSVYTFHYIHVLLWYACYAYHFGNKMPITNLIHVHPCYIITTSNELRPR